MIKHSDGRRHQLGEVREEFTRRYSYLKIETQPIGAKGMRRTADSRVLPEKVSDDNSDDKPTDDWLKQELGISDTMTVRELEDAVAERFGVQVQVFRRSGKFWIETRMTRDWTLKQQDDQGRDLAAGL